MAVVTILATGTEPNTFIVEMALEFGSLLMHIPMPNDDAKTQNPEQRKATAQARARSLASEFLANTSTNHLLN
jgi:hypothetical protein